MYTNILLIKREIKEKSKNKFSYNRNMNRYYKKMISPMYSKMISDLFIFKYDDIIELYRLIENYGETDIMSIVDDEYDFMSIVIDIKDIVSIRLDIDIDNHMIHLKIEEHALLYTIEYDFKDKIRFNMYHEDSKDKDQELINICNTIIIKQYIILLNRVYWGIEITTGSMLELAKKMYENKLDINTNE